MIGENNLGGRTTARNAVASIYSSKKRSPRYAGEYEIEEGNET